MLPSKYRMLPQVNPVLPRVFMRTTPSLCLIIACALLVLASPLHSAVSIPLGASADAFLSEATPGGNFGGAGAIAISAPGSAKAEFQTVMSFSFSAAKIQLDTTFGAGGWTVDALSLQLTAASPNNAMFNASAAGNIAVRWFADDTWVEGGGNPAGSNVPGLNYNSLSQLLASGTETAGSLAFGGGTSGVNTISLSLTSGLLADALNGSTASLNLHATDTTVSGLFNSRNNGTVANRPVLTLTASAIPEPSTWLSALLFLLVPVFRRNR